jgi:hypothetical protein
LSKHIDAVFPSSLLQAAANQNIGVSSNGRKEKIRCQVIVPLCV